MDVVVPDSSSDMSIQSHMLIHYHQIQRHHDNVIMVQKSMSMSVRRRELIQKLLLNQKCMGYLVHAYYSISLTRYYKDDSWWSADLKSNEKQILENFDMARSDAIFDENKLSSVPRPSLRIPIGTEYIGGSVVPEEVTEEGFRQKSGIYYFDTNALVARINIIRLLIAMELIHNLIIHHMDMKTTFLNGELEKGVKVDLTKEFLSSRFSMQDMEEADVILVSTPMDTSEKLMPNNGQAISQLEYSRVIGCLMYAITYTRPDIAFAVDKLSRYISNHDTQHWQVIQRVLKYLKKTMDYSLIYICYSSVLEGCTDASWINNTEDNSSTNGWVFLLAGGAIS
nr:zinc finger, CCHC-type [Tanacetum cinerariifolium]